jgi:HAD superfamily hydrolase (TIGR01490 family)
MSNAYAFFDVDGTLLRPKSMVAFHEYWYRQWTGLATLAQAREYEDVSATLRTLIRSDAPRELVNRRYYELFAGRPVDEVQRCARAWARSVTASPKNFFTEVVGEMARLRNQGIEPVLVSGSFIEVLTPIAEHLKVSQMLATRLQQVNGTYSGQILAPQTIGEGKAIAIKAFLSRQGVPSHSCWAFGDDVTDMPMLDAVGHPVAVIGDPALAAAARHRGWRLLQVSDPDGRVDAAA